MMDKLPGHRAKQATHRREPQRSREKLERILNAAHEIAAEVGFEATTLTRNYHLASPECANGSCYDAISQ